VTNSQATLNDYAAANIGQVKNIATKAVAEMNAKLEGGAGSELNALVASWTQPPATGVVRNDYAAVNQGQLKAIAKKFYDRLAAAGYSGPPLSSGQTYPWTVTTSDDASYAVVNIGQVKRVFSFVPALANPDLVDTDGDGMPDKWEIYYGLNPNSTSDASPDADGDGRTNLQEYLARTNPKNSADKATTISGDYDLIVATPGRFYGVMKSSGALTVTEAP
jgi:hypothetical protein